MPDDPPTIRIAAGLLHRADGRTLLVRKRGTAMFMQPGGKIEPSEEPSEALRREIFEELGLVIEPGEPVYIGRFTAPAAHELGWVVQAELFRVAVSAAVIPASEIEEIAWVDPADPGDLALAPLTRDHVLPIASRPGFPA